jgi:hypothetical protein
VRRSLAVLFLLAIPSAVAAQSSLLQVRGLGLPGRWLSARATASGGAFGLFDAESSLNPAAIGSVQTITAGFTGIQNFRSVDLPGSSPSLRETRFPLVTVAGPTKRFPLVLGLSYSSYTDRDFTLGTGDTLDLRGVPVPVFDTLSSRGGVSDLRVAAAYRFTGTTLGGGFHVLTGSDRLQSGRTFQDSTYLPVTEKTELSYAGIGASLGVIHKLGGGLAVAALVRSDGHLGVDQDSTRVSEMDLPYTFGLGARWQLSPRLALAGQGIVRTWSATNSDLLAAGAPGSENTIDVSFGAEYIGNPKRPSHKPLRLGGHYATLPFLLQAGQQPTEFGVAAGSGIRFAQERGGVDVALEYLSRSAGEFKERAFQVTIGVSVRP